MMMEFYQNLPNYVSPIAFSVGNFSLHWYSIMWLVAFGLSYFLLLWRVKYDNCSYKKTFVQDVVANSLVGAIIGGRLGYVIFYDFSYYVLNPLQIISPYNFTTHEWVGIYGMSYHGGVVGVAIAIIFTAKKYKEDILKLADFVVPVVPIAYMFGRIGNFLNAELIGRETSSKFGMHFYNNQSLYHPSQLYEAFFEGFVLFVILWSLRSKNLPKGMMVSLYLMGYAIFRIGIEFVRQPDQHLGFIVGSFTMGQILSIIMLIIGFALLGWSIKNKKR